MNTNRSFKDLCQWLGRTGLWEPSCGIAEAGAGGLSAASHAELNGHMGCAYPNHYSPEKE